MASKNLRRIVALGCFGLASVGLMGSLAAQECESDADCGEGQVCEIYEVGACPGAPPCVEGEECPEPEPCVTEEVGYCIVPPIACETDADCPSFLSCEALSGDVTCSVSDDGSEPICEEPEPSDEAFCAYVPIECAADTDCPEGFGCVSFSSPCPDIACPEGEDCPEIECEEETYAYCEPREIPCETNDECPAEWSCQTFESVSCSGSGEVEPDGGSDGGRGGQAEGDALAPEEDTSEDCTTETASLCVPPGFNGIATPLQDGVAESGTPRDAANDGDDGAEEAAGSDDGSDEADEESSACSVSSLSSKSSGGAVGAMIVGLLAALGLRRRRA